MKPRQMDAPSLDMAATQTHTEPALATIMRHGHDAPRVITDDTMRRGASRARSRPTAPTERNRLAEALRRIGSFLTRAVAGATRVRSDRERHRPSAGHETTPTESTRQRPSAGHESTTSTEERHRPSAGHEQTESQ